MDKEEEKRRNKLYEHEIEPDFCGSRGCPATASLDGIWKIRYKICSALRYENELILLYERLHSDSYEFPDN